MNAAQRQASRTINWVNVLLGIWVAISPFVLGFAQMTAVTWNCVGVGIAVALLALMRITGSKIGAVLNLLAGIWLVVSPFVMRFSQPVPFWNDIILGVLIGLSAIVAAGNRSQMEPAVPPAP